MIELEAWREEFCSLNYRCSAHDLRRLNFIFYLFLFLIDMESYLGLLFGLFYFGQNGHIIYPCLGRAHSIPTLIYYRSFFVNLTAMVL